MKKLAIMQPYFFPYLGYFSLIVNTDHFVFFDTSQYTPRSWMNRNRILNLKNDFTYITVPIKKMPRETAIKDIKLADEKTWANDLIAKLTVYQKKAPNYDKVISLIRDIAGHSFDGLADLNISSTVQVCNYLDIPIQYDVFSQMDLPIEAVNHPDEWALNITKAMGYDTYINPPGGKSFFDREKYKQAGIELRFLEVELKPYVQRIGRFESGLSIIDVMMFCDNNSIHDFLNAYTLS